MGAAIIAHVQAEPGATPIPADRRAVLSRVDAWPHRARERIPPETASPHSGGLKDTLDRYAGLRFIQHQFSNRIVREGKRHEVDRVFGNPINRADDQIGTVALRRKAGLDVISPDLQRWLGRNLVLCRSELVSEHLLELGGIALREVTGVDDIQKATRFSSRPPW